MTGFLFWTSLMAVIAWLIVITRLISVIRQHPHLSPIARQRVWLFWAAFFSFAVVVTIYDPLVQDFLKGSGWLRDIPIIALAIITYVIGTRICYGFAPALRPRWDWPLYTGIGALAVCVLVAWAAQTQPIVSRPLVDKAIFSRLIFAAFLIVVLGQVIVPAYVWAWRHEQQQPMRLRFRLIAGMHGTIALWLLLRVIEAAAWVVGLALSLGSVYVVLGVLITFLFSAHFLPPSLFVKMAQALKYLQNIVTYFFIRRVEIYAVGLIAWQASPFNWFDILGKPDVAVYRCVIAILDMRKMLRRCDYVAAQDLSDRLDNNLRLDMNYEEIVASLRNIGRGLGRRSRTAQSPVGLAI